MESNIPLTLQATPKGLEVLAITAGIGNGWIFSPDVLLASLSLWNGAECYADHTQDHHSVRDLGGILSNPVWDADAEGIRATLTPTGPAAAVFVELANAALSHPDLAVGLSADILMKVTGKKVMQIVKVRSLDAVTHPARGGKFIRVLQSKGNHMNEEEDPEDVSPEEQQQAALEMDDEIKQSSAALTATCGYLLTAALQSSKLPEVTRARLEKQYKGRIFTPAELETSIEDARKEVSALTAAHMIQGPRIDGMYNSDDMLRAAVFDLFGVPRDEDIKNVKPARLHGLRELYLGITGDYDLHGSLDLAHAQFQLSTTNFSVLVKNALNKSLVNHWDQFGKAGYNWWEPIVTVEHFNTVNDITWMLFGTIGSLPTVAEGAEYTPLMIGDNGETASFVKKGGYVGITLEAIDRDDLGAIKRLPKELAFAGIRELSALVAAIFTANSSVGPTLADTGALFNATAVTTAGGHANLLTTALGTDYTAWEAVAKAMYDQPMLVANETGYIGTGKKMAVDPKFCLVPRALRGAANTLFVSRQIGYGTDNLYYGQVFPITVPEWTDATDWAAVADPNIIPGIMIGERFGLVPEIFIAGNETDPAVFMNDESRIKVRSFLAVGVADFRPLHKENVAG
jgi:hypothetical protein